MTQKSFFKKTFVGTGGTIGPYLSREKFLPAVFTFAPPVNLERVMQIGLFDAIFNERKEKMQNFF